MNPIILPSPGLHYGVPFEDYQKWPAVNFSKLKPIRGTASKCKWDMDHPKEPTPAMKIGSALHVATLEPGRFDGMFHICPPCDRRTTEGKKTYAENEALAGSKLMIRQGSADDESVLGELERVKASAVAIQNHKVARLFLDCAGHNEVSAVWRDDETGLMCKARFDRLVPSFKGFNNVPVVVEIKTDRDARPWAFGKTCHERQYAGQAASYSHAHYKITGIRPAHVFIVVENFAPFDVQCFTLDDNSLQAGLLEYRDMLNRYAVCEKSGNWPGYEETLEVLSLPKYATEFNN